MMTRATVTSDPSNEQLEPLRNLAASPAPSSDRWAGAGFECENTLICLCGPFDPNTCRAESSVEVRVGGGLFAWMMHVRFEWAQHGESEGERRCVAVPFEGSDEEGGFDLSLTGWM